MTFLTDSLKKTVEFLEPGIDPFRYIKKREGVKIIEIGEGGKI